MNNKLIKSSFRPPGKNKTGFKPPTRIGSQETNTSLSLSSTPSNIDSQGIIVPVKAGQRKPLKEISNTSDGSIIQQTPTESSASGPSIIWDSQGSQPIADAELPDWAKELPETSESFLNRTNDAQSESNLIDVSIFDDVLRKTLCGEQTVEGGLVADIKTGVEVTHESPTIWSSQEISNRLSQSQKSIKSTQSENPESYSQVFESSQNSTTAKVNNCNQSSTNAVQSDTIPNIKSRPNSPDFDAFEAATETPAIAQSSQGSKLEVLVNHPQKSAITTQCENPETNSQDFQSSQNAPETNMPNIKFKPQSPEFDEFEAENETPVIAQSSQGSKYEIVKNQSQKSVKSTHCEDPGMCIHDFDSGKNAAESDTPNDESRPHSPEFDAFEAGEETPVKAQSSQGSRYEALKNLSQRSAKSTHSENPRLCTQDLEKSQNSISTKVKGCDPYSENPSDIQNAESKPYSPNFDAFEAVKETPVKAQSSQGSKFEALMDNDSEDTSSEYDAIDDHVFSQVMNQVERFCETFTDDNSNVSDKDQYELVDEKGDCSTSDNNINNTELSHPKQSIASDIAKQSRANHSSKPVTSGCVKKPRNVTNEREKERTLYHKTLMKRHHDSRILNKQKNKRVNLTSKKSTSFQGSLKKRLLELQSSRDEAVWVECCKSNCKKWRYLQNVNDPAELPNIWTCNMNQDARFNTCLSPEQGISEVGEKLENFVECSYTVGSIVWAKVPGDLWWPAMVDDDPDTEDFYWTDDLEDHFSVMLVPSWYHVVFFETSKETKVERAWVRTENLKRFKIGEPMPKNSKNLPIKIEQKLKIAVKTAEYSLKMDVFDRRSRYCFAARYRGKWGPFVDWENMDEDEEIDV